MCAHCRRQNYEKTFSHEIYGEKFYIFDLEVPRLSKALDIIPITVSERLITNIDLQIGKKLVVEGQFRSYNSYENERNKLILTVFAKDIAEAKEEEKTDDKRCLSKKMEGTQRTACSCRQRSSAAEVSSSAAHGVAE